MRLAKIADIYSFVPQTGSWLDKDVHMNEQIRN